MFTPEHIALAAVDTVALKDWYCRVLGARPVMELQRTPPAFLIELSGLTIELFTASHSAAIISDNSLAGWRHLALRVQSLAEARSNLEAKGVVFTQRPKPAGGGGTVLFFSDPEGNLLHLVERPPGWK